jgi:tetratricopeptide (TPR) repeat protein
VDRGVQLAHEVGDDALLARAHWVRGYTKALIGYEESLADLLDAVALAERADSDDLAAALNFVTSAYFEQGAFALAKPYAERALAVAERRQVPADIVFMRANVGELAFFQGDWDEAREHFAHAAALQERLDPAFTWGLSGIAQVYLCLLDLAQGRAVEESSRRLEALLAILRGRISYPPLFMGALGAVALAERHLLMGRAAAARARLVAFLDQPELAEHARMAGARVIALPTLAWAEAELGRDAEATERLELALDAQPLHLVEALRVKGLLLTRQRRWEDARAALDETITLCRAMPYPYVEAKAHYVYGQLHTAMGETARAGERFEQALILCHRLGERLYAERIECMLLELGHAPPHT